MGRPRGVRTLDCVGKVFDLYQCGLSQGAIASGVGLDRGTVGQILREAGHGGYNYSFCSALSQHQKNVLVGTLLGDAALVLGSPTYNPQLVLGHGPEQRDYLIWKAAQLGDLFLKKNPRQYNHLTGYVSYHLESRRHPMLRFYYDLFYSRPAAECGPHVYKKQLTHQLLDLVNDEVLAIWWCDDGAILRRGADTTRQDLMRWVLGALTLREYEAALQLFRNRGFSPKMDHCAKANAVVLRFNVEESKRLAWCIYPFVPGCMRYKLGKVQHGRD
jgi:hypothetical protein